MTAVLILAAIQGLVGAFDLAFHHEFTERLTWKTGTGRELGLHAARNALYAVIFLVLAWAEPHGWWVAVFVAVLAAEVAITLADFIVEDRTRLLPESERIIHTLLAVSYGAFLALLTPHLVAWASEPGGLVLVERGLWSVLFTVFALGVGLWALRDAARARAVASPALPAGPLVTPFLPSPMRVLVTGGTGFIGRRLVAALVGAGHHVTVLTRDPRKARDLAMPVTVATAMGSIPADTIFDAVVNLAGASVAGGRWSARRKDLLRTSRIDTTRDLIHLMGRLETRPRVLVSASATGFYGTDNDDLVSEESPHAAGFAHDLCAAREAEARKACRFGVRVVELRFGLVLAAHGGPLGAMMPAFEFGLGARLGCGRQWMPWLHLDDAVRMIAFAIAREDLRGPFNAVAPQPVRNADFSVALAAALHRPCLFTLPAPLIHGLLGEMGQELLLASRRAVPMRMQQAGFEFLAPTLEQALERSLTRSPQDAPACSVDALPGVHAIR